MKLKLKIKNLLAAAALLLLISCGGPTLDAEKHIQIVGINMIT